MNNVSDAELGLIEVFTKDVIKACKSTLFSIYKHRAKHRRQFVEQYRASYWNTFWNFGKKPTRSAALHCYYKGEHMPCAESFYALAQENNCKTILHAANINKSDSMWITLSAARACNLGSYQ